MTGPPDAERDPLSAPVELTAEARAIIGGFRRVVIPTDASDDALARLRETTLHLARDHGFDVVLYDRSDERWTDTPHPIGPLSAADVDADRRPHLVRQLRDFEAGGVRATAWLATVPALTAMLDVLQELDVDGVLLPDHLDDPKVMDRLQIGSDTAGMVERVAELQMPNPPTVLMVPASGAISITTSKEAT